MIFRNDHSFWLTAAHGKCEQVLQIIACQCYLKLNARTPASALSGLLSLHPQQESTVCWRLHTSKGTPSPVVGLLAWTHHGMEGGIAHFSSPTCMTQPAFMDIIPNSMNGAFQGNDTCKWFHSGKAILRLHNPNIVTYMICLIGNLW